MLTHTAYLDTLESTNSLTDEWRAILAGFLVLRLVEAWLKNDIRSNVESLPGMVAVQDALANVPEHHPVQADLAEIVAVLRQAETIHIREVGPYLLRYGDTLCKKNQWELAHDGFTSLLIHAQAAKDIATTIEATRRLAYIYRSLGRFEDAEREYARAITQARRANHPSSARILSGLSSLYASRGDLTRAASILDEVAIEIEKYGLADLAVETTLDRATLCYLRHDYTESLRWCHTGLRLTTDESFKFYLLGNAGAALMSMGDLNAAKNVLLPIGVSDDERIRQMALLNLFELAGWQGDRVSFERYRQELDGTLSLPHLRAHYFTFLAEGLHTFGQQRAAVAALHEAIGIATAYGLGPILTSAKMHQRVIEGTP